MKSRQSTSASLVARLLKGEDPAVLAKSLLREASEPESFHRPKECREAAERTDNAVHRVRLLKAAREWWQDAEALRVRLRRVDRLP